MTKDMVAVILAFRRRAKRMTAMRKRGMTYADIGAHFGISRQAAHSIVKRANSRKLDSAK
jgi:DNA-directed RNA polymerase specialized sigma24 family protein